MHGDAAFAGQGVVAECFGLSELDGLPHRRHDPLHRQQPDRLHHLARATRAPRPIRPTSRKMIEAPIFHVNGDDPEAVVLRRRDRRPSSARSSTSRRRHRHVLLPPLRPQRGRRADASPSR
ncbi:MAG: hypothetical protein MZV49_03595 [Rhodopseudomonas palustris]|nr:hypothetical protein [Rhodopseudomonas palustris]